MKLNVYPQIENISRSKWKVSEQRFSIFSVFILACQSIHSILFVSTRYFTKQLKLTHKLPDSVSIRVILHIIKYAFTKNHVENRLQFSKPFQSDFGLHSSYIQHLVTFSFSPIAFTAFSQLHANLLYIHFGPNLTTLIWQQIAKIFFKKRYSLISHRTNI